MMTLHEIEVIKNLLREIDFIGGLIDFGQCWVPEIAKTRFDKAIEEVKNLHKELKDASL